MGKLRKFAISATICGLLLFASSGYVLADAWLNAKSIGNKTKALPSEIVISDDDEENVLEVTNSLNGDFVLGEGNIVRLGYIKVKNQTDDKRISFKFQSFLEETNKPIYVDGFETSKLFNRLHIEVKDRDSEETIYRGYLADFDFGSGSNKFSRIEAGDERTYEFFGTLRDLDVELAEEEMIYGIGIIKK